MFNVLTTSRGAAPARRRTTRHDLVWAMLFLAPAAIALCVLRLLPTISAVASSLYKSFPGGIVTPTFAGAGNYLSLFGDPQFLGTISRTILFNLVINPLQIGIALLIAALLVRRVHFAGLWRTLIFIPITVPVVGSCVAWGAALNPQGPINALLSAVGGTPQPFFNSPSQALASIIVVASWIGIGYWMLFLISGLEAIPEEIYEAARLDRSGPIRTFFFITVPLLRRPLLFVLVADTVANFVLFVPVQLLTQGGPQHSTNLLMYDAYETTYTFGSVNTGAAEIVVLTTIMLAFVLLQFRLLREPK